jgi:hypothetical protein
MFTAYLRERFPLRIFGLAAIGIVAAAGWATIARPTPATRIYATAFSAFLVLQFRLWDDLEDRAHDRTLHPERLMVRTPGAQYGRVLICLAVAKVPARGIRRSPAAVEVALLDLVFFMAYRRTRRHVPDAAWRYSILLIKYPAFVLVIATVLGAPQPGRLAVAALVAYLAACGYEALHGARHRAGVTS